MRAEKRYFSELSCRETIHYHPLSATIVGDGTKGRQPLPFPITVQGDDCQRSNKKVLTYYAKCGIMLVWGKL